jgi:hypothetical protein
MHEARRHDFHWPAFATLGAAWLAASACERAPHTAGVDASPVEARATDLANAIRDAGYLCDTLLEATDVDGTAQSWRVLCNDMLVYVVSADDAGALHVEPVAYGAPGVVQPRSQDPEKQPDTQGPEP